MFLEKIEISGFKSFAQKTVLEFPRPGKGCPLIRDTSRNGQSSQLRNGTCGVVCIIGPNGSGKSNIVDAVRWVLGEQSLKNLRGKKSQDVIFVGSEKKARLNLAQVTLQINNEDGSMAVDYPQVLISRKLYRNGESEYLINKKAVRLQDILLLVAKSNFGQKSYSIISQGTIDSIILANPNERKEYFDEAVGVKQFQLKRDQSINKLENAWQNLKQAQALLSEIEPRLNSLTRQVKRLEKREKVEQNLKNQQKQYYGFLWQQIENGLKDLKPKHEELKKQVEQKEKEVLAIQKQLEVLEKEDSRTQVFNRWQKNYQNFLLEKNKLLEKQLILENKIKLNKERKQTSKSTLPSSEILKRLKGLEQVFEKITVLIQAAKEPKDLTHLKEGFQSSLLLLKELIKEIESPATKEAASEELAEFSRQLQNFKKETEVVDQEIGKTQKELQNFNITEEQKRGKFFSLQRQIQLKQKEFNNLSGGLSQIRVEVARLDTKKEDLENEILQELKNKDWLKNFSTVKINENEVYAEIQKLKHQLELIGSIEPETVKEYQETKERYDFLSGQVKDLNQSIDSLEKIIDDLDRQIQVKFDTAFRNINQEFQQFFKILFNGGKAELSLMKEDLTEAVKPPEPEITQLSEGDLAVNLAPLIKEPEISPKRFLKKRTGKVIVGIDIIAAPPGKKITSINMLSGGEKALVSIALICAIIANNPSPFVILDEVDAALDETNSQKFSQILENLAHQTQFIIITHNWSTMEKSDILYGVTMDEAGVSRILSLRLEEAEKMKVKNKV